MIDKGKIFKEEFLVSGRVYDQLTTKPLQGVLIKPLLAKGKEVKTDVEGNFSINLEIEVYKREDEETIISQPQLSYTLKGYIPFFQEVLTKDRKVREEIPIVSMLNVKEAAKQELAELQNKLNDKIEEINKIYLSLPDRVVMERRKAILKIVNSLQTKLLPVIIEMLIAFGISKISQKKGRICPSSEKLGEVIKSRNSITKQLNQFYKTIAVNVALAAAFTAIAALFNKGRITIQNLPIPLGAPTGIGQPYSLVSKLQVLEEDFKELEKHNKNLNKQILMSLVYLVGALAVIITLLKEIDSMSQECAQNQNFTLEEIDKELINLTIQEEEKGNPVISQLNGFIFSIETEKVPIGSLTRRYAVAKNSQGVVLLKGEPSFSSNSQILIDELIFYIETNDLKAY